MQLIDMIFYWAKTDPHRSALVQPEMITTYQALADAIVSIGDKVESLNLDRTQPIAVSLTKSFVFYRCGAGDPEQGLQRGFDSAAPLSSFGARGNPQSDL